MTILSYMGVCPIFAGLSDSLYIVLKNCLVDKTDYWTLWVAN